MTRTSFLRELRAFALMATAATVILGTVLLLLLHHHLGLALLVAAALFICCLVLCACIAAGDADRAIERHDLGPAFDFTHGTTHPAPMAPQPSHRGAATTGAPGHIPPGPARRNLPRSTP